MLQLDNVVENAPLMVDFTAAPGGMLLTFMTFDDGTDPNQQCLNEILAFGTCLRTGSISVRYQTTQLGGPFNEVTGTLITYIDNILIPD